jgi:hypothetical protein
LSCLRVELILVRHGGRVRSVRSAVEQR